MPSEISLEQSSHIKWKRHHSFSGKFIVYNIRRINNHLYACHLGGIDVYTISLQHVDTIKASDMGVVYDMCGEPSGGFVVAATNGLFKLKGNGESVNDRIAFDCAVLIARVCIYSFFND